MNEDEYKKLFERALNFGKGKKLSEQEAEDFAQECCIKAFEVGSIKLEYIWLNYRDKNLANKRILSSIEGQFLPNGTISLDSPIDSSTEDSAKFGDVIGVPGDDLELRDILRDLSRIVSLIIGCAKSNQARDWAYRCFKKDFEEKI